MKIISLPLSSLFLTLTVMGCDIDPPIKEMVTAKTAIKRAYEVRADRYDTANLEKAEQGLYDSHDSLGDEKNKSAQKNAEISVKAARKAIQTSLPLLAQDSLKEAQGLHEKAEKLNATGYAPDDMAAAGTFVEEAQEELNDKKYWESHLSSEKAKRSLRSALAAAEEAISKIEVEISRLKAERDNLITLDSKKTAETELAKAGESLTRADESLKEDLVKDAEQAVLEARQYIKVAKLKILSVSAKEKIGILRANIENLKKERGDDFAPQEIEQSLSSLNEAESLLEQEKPEEARLKISDAENHYLAALLKAEQGTALDKIQTAGALLERIRQSDTGNKFEQDINNADTLIAEARRLYDARSYGQAGSKADEAHTLLSSLSISIEEEYGIKPDKMEEMRIYVVRLNINDRDCLWKIAHRLYKNARMWPLIYMANKEQIKDPDLIFPGQRFKIPPVPKKKQPGEKPEKDEEAAIKQDDATEASSENPEETADTEQ